MTLLDALAFDLKKAAHRLSMARKFYVVWSGRQTGVFTDWATTQRAVDKYAGARLSKSFPTRAEAQQAFGRGAYASIPPKTAGRQKGSAPDSERRATHTLINSMSAFIAMVPVNPTPATPAPASWCIEPANSRNCGLACTTPWEPTTPPN